MSSRLKIIATGCIVITTVIAIHLAIVNQSESRQSLPSRQIALWPTTLELGSGKVGEIKEGMFYLRNQSDSEVNYNIVTSCNCTKVEPRSGTIKPHVEIPIKAQLKLRESGLDEAVTIQAECNSNSGKLALSASMQAKCPAPFAASPKRLDFLKMTEGQTCQQTVVLTCSDGKNIEAADYSVDCNNPCIRTKLQSLTDGRIGLLVSVTSPLGKEELSERVQVFCKRLDHSVVIPVIVDCTNPIQFSPAILRLNTTLGDSRADKNLFVWTTDIAKTDKVTIASPKGISVHLAETLTNGRLRYRVAFDDSYVPSNNERIRISLEGEQSSSRYVTVVQQ